MLLRPRSGARRLSAGLALAWGLACALGWAGPAWAQKPAPAPSPANPKEAAPANPKEAAPTAAPSPPAVAKPETEAPPCTVAVPCLSAERQESFSKDHSRASGFVDLQFGEARIQADEMDMFGEEKPDGSHETRVEAKGNVVFLRGEERLSGERLVMNLTTGRGTFENAVGFVEPGVFVEARRIERRDAHNYRIQGGRFTSCAQPTPRWRFSSSSAALKVDDRITARNVLFKVKQLPVLYLPYFAYPIREDQRSTGFLIPSVGRVSQLGKFVKGGFFWAMGRSQDQTFYLERYDMSAFGIRHELRYRATPPSSGTFDTYFLRREQSGQTGWDHEYRWDAVQKLPGKVQATVHVNETSSVQFREQFQDLLDNLSSRTRFSSGSLQRSFGPTVVSLLADSTDTLYHDPVTSENLFRRVRHLPSLKVSRTPQRVHGSRLVFGFETRAENLSLGDQARVDSFGRYDVYPRLSLPLSLPFLQLTPDVALRYTAYGVSDVAPPESNGSDPLDLSGPPVTRRYAETNVRLVGPSFQRVFLIPGNFYTEKFKHVIEPQVTWTYRSSFAAFNQIPAFDGDDRIPPTNQFDYALEQRFYAKRPGPSGKAETYEFLSWRLAQSYYLQTGASPYDPNYVSDVTGREEPNRFSLVESRVNFRPTRHLGSSFITKYNIYFHKPRQITLSARADYPRLHLSGSWDRLQQVRRGLIVANTVDGRVAFGLPGGLWLDNRTTYDLNQKKVLQAIYQVHYGIQCCGVSAGLIRNGYNSTQPWKFLLSIELANIGSVPILNADQGSAFGIPR